MSKSKRTPEQEDAKKFLDNMKKEKKAATRKPFTDKIQEFQHFCKVMAGVIAGFIFLSHAGYAVYELSKTHNELWRGAFAVWAASSAVVGLVLLWRAAKKVSE